MQTGSGDLKDFEPVSDFQFAALRAALLEELHASKASFPAQILSKVSASGIHTSRRSMGPHDARLSQQHVHFCQLSCQNVALMAHRLHQSPVMRMHVGGMMWCNQSQPNQSCMTLVTICMGWDVEACCKGRTSENWRCLNLLMRMPGPL